jgi:uncharacterized UPF0160 family protein
MPRDRRLTGRERKIRREASGQGHLLEPPHLLARILHRFPVLSVVRMRNRLRWQSGTNTRDLGGFFNAGRHRGHSHHFYLVPGPAPVAS